MPELSIGMPILRVVGGCIGSADSLARAAGVATTGADVVVVAKTEGAFCAVAAAIASWTCRTT
jgi:hypothetical protein